MDKDIIIQSDEVILQEISAQVASHLDCIYQTKLEISQKDYNLGGKSFGRNSVTFNYLLCESCHNSVI